MIASIWNGSRNHVCPIFQTLIDDLLLKSSLELLIVDECLLCIIVLFFHSDFIHHAKTQYSKAETIGWAHACQFEPSVSANHCPVDCSTYERILKDHQKHLYLGYCIFDLLICLDGKFFRILEKNVNEEFAWIVVNGRVHSHIVLLSILCLHLYSIRRKFTSVIWSVNLEEELCVVDGCLWQVAFSKIGRRWRLGLIGEGGLGWEGSGWRNGLIYGGRGRLIVGWLLLVWAKEPVVR